jgi:hypothetical protein
MTVHYRTQDVGDVEVFYREAGPKDAPSSRFCMGTRQPVTCSAI